MGHQGKPVNVNPPAESLLQLIGPTEDLSLDTRRVPSQAPISDPPLGLNDRLESTTCNSAMVSFSRRDLLIAWWCLCGVAACVLFSVSSGTYAIDDIQVSILHIGGGGLLVLFCWLWRRGTLALPHRRVMLPLAGWFAVALFSSVLHQAGALPGSNRHQWIGWIRYREFLALLGVFLIAAGTARSLWLADRSARFWVLMLAVQGALGLFQWVGGTRFVYAIVHPGTSIESAWASLLYAYAIRSRALISTVTGLSTFADLVVLWTPLAIVGTATFRQSLWRFLSCVAVGVSFLCFLLWRPETSTVAYLFALLLLAVGARAWTWVTRLPALHRRVLLVGIVIVGLTVLFFQTDRIPDHAMELRTNISKYAVVWTGGLRIFLRHPIAGGGLGSFGILFPGVRSPDYLLTGYVTHVTPYPNNLAVWLLAETGILGMACFLWFLFELLRRGWRSAREGSGRRRRRLALAATSGVAAFLLTTLLHTGFHYPPGAVAFWAMAGLLAGLTEENHPTPGQELNGKPSVSTECDERGMISRNPDVEESRDKVGGWVNRNAIRCRFRWRFRCRYQGGAVTRL